ncbi:hypothetical protein Amsp01_088450 [Amycolatopsis sp. NBRC 101858]|uniref:hypothetical protein n=1 Tax=Amycolatopsis sp. NBRC 101858 TaxID=3032200 RepID=UPI0024A5CB6B|nr:hypothetical protein [Amycolatopsis sp. NBRC 101858]GLY42822.1 hypothetical protein Amsp01_088450 [Amycolatopsis sp. NBRC 101858]
MTSEEESGRRGGDSACWLSHVCPDCGRFVDGGPAEAEAHCAESVEPADQGQSRVDW